MIIKKKKIIKRIMIINIYKKNFMDSTKKFEYYNGSDACDLVPFSIRDIKYSKKLYINKDSILTIDDYFQRYNTCIRNNVIKSDYFLYPKKSLKVIKARIKINFFENLNEYEVLEVYEVDVLILKDSNFKFFGDPYLSILDENINDYIILLKWNDIFIRYTLYFIENKKLLEKNIEDFNMTYMEMMYLYLKKNDWYNDYTEFIRFYNISAFFRVKIYKLETLKIIKNEH